MWNELSWVFLKFHFRMFFLLFLLWCCFDLTGMVQFYYNMHKCDAAKTHTVIYAHRFFVRVYKFSLALQFTLNILLQELVKRTELRLLWWCFIYRLKYLTGLEYFNWNLYLLLSTPNLYAEWMKLYHVEILYKTISCRPNSIPSKGER